MSDLKKDQRQRQGTQHIARQISGMLADHPGIAAVYLLGSAATGALRDDSDIDIALLPVDEQAISFQSRLDMATSLELRLKRTIDIGVITSKNLIYASEAILKGRRIVTVQKDYAEAQETRLLGCYLTFRQDRKKVEESYSVA